MRGANPPHPRMIGPRREFRKSGPPVGSLILRAAMRSSFGHCDWGLLLLASPFLLVTLIFF